MPYKFHEPHWCHFIRSRHSSNPLFIDLCAVKERKNKANQSQTHMSEKGQPRFISAPCTQDSQVHLDSASKRLLNVVIVKCALLHLNFTPLFSGRTTHTLRESALCVMGMTDMQLQCRCQGVGLTDESSGFRSPLPSVYQ